MFVEQAREKELLPSNRPGNISYSQLHHKCFQKIMQLGDNGEGTRRRRRGVREERSVSCKRETKVGWVVDRLDCAESMDSTERLNGNFAGDDGQCKRQTYINRA